MIQAQRAAFAVAFWVAPLIASGYQAGRGNYAGASFFFLVATLPTLVGLTAMLARSVRDFDDEATATGEALDSTEVLENA